MTRPLRALLYVPASNPRALARARGLACDGVIVDLEDAVGPDQKDGARTAMVEAITAGGFQAPTVVVRVNGLETPWGEADLRAALDAQPDAILVPKVRGRDDLRAWSARMTRTPAAPPLWAMLETCAAIMNLGEISACATAVRLEALVMGLEDLAREMHCRPGSDRAPLLPALAGAVTAARAAGLAALDGVFPGLGDPDGLRTQCEQGRALGFDGKTVIHPDQIDATIRAFSPSLSEIQWARQVVEAFGRPESAGRGVLRLDGRMIERLHLEEAQDVLRLAQS